MPAPVLFLSFVHDPLTGSAIRKLSYDGIEALPGWRDLQLCTRRLGAVCDDNSGGSAGLNYYGTFLD